jgi:TonB family protein
MKKIVLITVFYFVSSLAIAQVNIFIGQSRTKIIDYWSTKISNEYFKTWDEDGAFTIMYDDSFTPNFIAYFDKNNICISHTTLIKENNISIVNAKIKKAGFIYDEKLKIWKNEKRKLLIIYEPINTLNGINIMFTLECIILNSQNISKRANELKPAKPDSILLESKQSVKVQKLDTIIIEPKIIDEKKFFSNLSYPKDAVNKGIQGTCYVSFMVEIDSTITNVEIKKGVPDAKMLDNAAIIAIKASSKNWRPATKNGQAIRREYIYPIRFKLH